MRARWLVTIVCACSLFATGEVRADDPIVRLDPALQRFDRRLPSSTAFVLEVRAPGKAALRGQVEVWPAVGGDCTLRPTREAQHHVLAMMPVGADGERSLRATVPPLQVDTPFCFSVQVFRGLDEVQAIGFAAQVTDAVFPTAGAVGASYAVDLSRVCGRELSAGARRARLAAALAGAVADLSDDEVERARRTAALATLAAAAGPAAMVVRPAVTGADRDGSARALAARVLGGLDVEALCGAYRAADEASAAVDPLLARASADLAAAHAALPPLVAAAPVTARLPLFVSGTPPQVRRYDALSPADTALGAAAIELEAAHPELAQALHDVENAPAAGRAAAYKVYQDELRALPAGPAVLSYVVAGNLVSADLDALFPSQRPDEAEADWRRRQAVQRGLVLANLDLLRRQLAALHKDDPDAARWFAALDALERADQAATAVAASKKLRLDAVDVARQAITSAVKARLTDADVRELMTNVTSIATTQTTRSGQSDDGVSSVSPDVGAMLAFPFGVDADLDGWRPWLVPYAGVNVYVERVDRVVPFAELVGPAWRQRLSVTVGALLTRPRINGAAISMPFRDSGLVPVLAVGYRLTSFTRASVGGFAFDYQDANPASAARHRAGAVWVGLSIDADVWTTVAGKAFK